MQFTVLIVDDSSFFQQRLSEIVNEHPQLRTVGVAANGQEAIDQEEALRPDIISMDYEMPYMDGVTAIKAILKKRKVPIVMFSSLTYEGAQITLDSLEAGAVDFIPKNFAEVSRNSIHLKRKIHEKLLAFVGDKRKPENTARSSDVLPSKPRGQASPASFKVASNTQAVPKKTQNVPASVNNDINVLAGVDLLVIGASTGGPVAVSGVVTKLPADFPVPIVVVQHMPENFTFAYAERLNNHSALNVKEAKHGDAVKRGQVFVAPGGKQLIFDKHQKTIKIVANHDKRVNYRPSVDITFASAASAYGRRVLAVVLTGMGADGCEGARLLKQSGAQVWAQSRESCVVYGMPAAIVNAGLADEIVHIDHLHKYLV